MDFTLAIAVQSPSQLVERWGEHGARTVTNNANAGLYLGGLTVPQDLEAVSLAAGQRWEPLWSDDHRGSHPMRQPSGYRLARTLTPDAVRTLPKGHAPLIYRSASPVIVRSEDISTRHRGRSDAMSTPAPPPWWMSRESKNPRSGVPGGPRRHHHE